jgi:antitoxin YefM
MNMTILNATEARSKLYSLIDETASTHQPIIITGKRGNAVLLSEEDWNSISETLYLLSVPGVRESIKEGMNESIEECSKELDW